MTSQSHRAALVQSTLAASDQGQLHFGEVVARLMDAQVEAYQVDYRAGRATCYLPGDETLDLPISPSGQAVADAFDAAAVRAAILGAQQGRVMYPEFKQLTQRAGCVGYTVWITGRQVVYVGRRGETHVERFPQG